MIQLQHTIDSRVKRS